MNRPWTKRVNEATGMAMCRLLSVAAVLVTGVSVVFAAPSAGLTNEVASISSTNSVVEKEFKALMDADDEAQAEAEKWISDNDAFAEKGGGVSNDELNRRIRDRLEPVRKSYQEFVQRHPEHVLARVAYGSFLRDLHDESGALEQWEHALALDTNNPVIYNDLGTWYAENEPKRKALEFMDKAAQLSPSEPLYQHSLADFVYLFRKEARDFYSLTEAQAFEKALQLYRNALRLDPGNFPYATDIANVYYAMRPIPTEAALGAWTNALRLARNDADREGVFIHLARIHMAAGHFEEARRILEKVANPNYADLKTRLLRSISQQETLQTNSPSGLLVQPGGEKPPAAGPQRDR
jgi:tetratricopeptide (TPR) repeat protein